MCIMYKSSEQTIVPSYRYHFVLPMECTVYKKRIYCIINLEYSRKCYIRHCLTAPIRRRNIMADYYISHIKSGDRRGNALVDALLAAEGIRRDGNLDYTCGMFDDDMNLIATGSCYGNTLRCMAVDSAHQGEGLMNQIVTHLMEVQVNRGNTRLFLYTKCSSAKFFGDLGFYEIARVDGQVVFMENRRNGFSDYLKKLKDAGIQGQSDSIHKSSLDRAAALVMNANPFTLGHQYLVEKAAAENRTVHLFIVSEDSSLIPFPVRRQLVKEGTSHLPNIICHDSGPYIISSATFPSYFQKDEASVIESHARLDLAVFTRIAANLHITRRYVGEEPASMVTGIYNRIMEEELPKSGVECIVVPRRAQGNQIISASTVRLAVKEGNMELLRSMVPEGTLRFFLSAEAKPVIQRIRETEYVIHY